MGSKPFRAVAVQSFAEPSRAEHIPELVHSHSDSLVSRPTIRGRRHPSPHPNDTWQSYAERTSLPPERTSLPPLQRSSPLNRSPSSSSTYSHQHDPLPSPHIHSPTVHLDPAPSLLLPPSPPSPYRDPDRPRPRTQGLARRRSNSGGDAPLTHAHAAAARSPPQGDALSLPHPHPQGVLRSNSARHSVDGSTLLLGRIRSGADGLLSMLSSSRRSAHSGTNHVQEIGTNSREAGADLRASREAGTNHRDQGTSSHDVGTGHPLRTSWEARTEQRASRDAGTSAQDPPNRLVPLSASRPPLNTTPSTRFVVHNNSSPPPSHPLQNSQQQQQLQQQQQQQLQQQQLVQQQNQQQQQPNGDHNNNNLDEIPNIQNHNPNTSNASSSTDENDLPPVNRDQNVRNSYDINPNVYMFLKAQEMGFDRGRIREVIETRRPATLNQLLHHLINHSPAIEHPVPQRDNSSLIHYSMQNNAMVEQNTIYDLLREGSPDPLSARGESNPYVPSWAGPLPSIPSSRTTSPPLHLPSPLSSPPPPVSPSLSSSSPPHARPMTTSPPLRPHTASPPLRHASRTTSTTGLPLPAPTPCPPRPPCPSPPPLSTSTGVSDGLCVICLEEKAECAIIPCGHLCTCLKCGKKLRECPMCRSNMNGILRVFKV